MSFSYRLACSLLLSSDENTVFLSVPVCLDSVVYGFPIASSPSHPFHLACRSIPPLSCICFSSLKRHVRMIYPGRRAGRKTGRPSHNEERPEKRNETYTIKRYAANYSPSETASSGKRGKSRIRERQYSYCSLLIAISAGIPSVRDVVMASKRSRISTIRSCVARDGTGSL